MRIIFGIAIALPTATIFCLSYLILFALETWRGTRRSPRGARSVRSVPLQQSPWISPARIAA